MPGTIFLPAAGPGGAVIAMTANAFKEDEEAALNAGMQAHIAKPIDVDKLLQESILKFV